MKHLSDAQTEKFMQKLAMLAERCDAFAKERTTEYFSCEDNRSEEAFDEAVRAGAALGARRAYSVVYAALLTIVERNEREMSPTTIIPDVKEVLQ